MGNKSAVDFPYEVVAKDSDISSIDVYGNGGDIHLKRSYGFIGDPTWATGGPSFRCSCNLRQKFFKTVDRNIPLKWNRTCDNCRKQYVLRLSFLLDDQLGHADEPAKNIMRPFFMWQIKVQQLVNLGKLLSKDAEDVSKLLSENEAYQIKVRRHVEQRKLELKDTADVSKQLSQVGASQTKLHQLLNQGKLPPKDGGDASHPIDVEAAQ